MKSPGKYFVFNKKSDYLRGSSENIDIMESGIRVSNNGAKGIFFSRLLDSREKKTQWHRLLVERNFISEASVKFLIYVSESRTIEQEGKSYDIGELLGNLTIPISLKQQMFEPYLAETFEDPEDALLFHLVGRYLWFQVVMVSQGDSTTKIERIQIYFPKNSWIEYLPEIYQTNRKSASFVERYLGIFQSQYQDMTKQIETVARYFDPDSVDEKLLRWLAEWIAIDDDYVWTEEKLRYLVKNAMELYPMRGTVEYLESMIKLYTGMKPYVVEQHQIEPYRTGARETDLINHLYGDSKYIFTVIVTMGTVVSNKEYKILTKIVENAKPAHIESNIVVLEPFIFLNQHSYLGINSVLGQYHDFVLDGQAAISFTTIS